MRKRRTRTPKPPFQIAAFHQDGLIYTLKDWLSLNSHKTPHNFYQWARSHGYTVRCVRTFNKTAPDPDQHGSS